jgi:hypothetical protein
MCQPVAASADVESCRIVADKAFRENAKVHTAASDMEARRFSEVLSTNGNVPMTITSETRWWMETLRMSARDRRQVEVLSRVAREELTLVKAAELMGVGYRQAKRL